MFWDRRTGSGTRENQGRKEWCITGKSVKLAVHDQLVSKMGIKQPTATKRDSRQLHRLHRLEALQVSSGVPLWRAFTSLRMRLMGLAWSDISPCTHTCAKWHTKQYEWAHNTGYFSPLGSVFSISQSKHAAAVGLQFTKALLSLWEIHLSHLKSWAAILPQFQSLC